MNYQVRHVTTYDYSEPVSLSHHLVHLTPRPDDGQRCLQRELKITPTPLFRRERIDSYGNRVTYFSIEEPHRRLCVEAAFTVSVARPARPPALFPTTWEQTRDRLRRGQHADEVDAFGYTFNSPHVVISAELASYAAACFTPGRRLMDAALALTTRIYQEFTYDPQATTVATPVAEVMRARRGVCQDFSHLAIACLRSLGLACRYVSGYLLTQPPPGRPRLVGADASHAWISVYLPDFGWVDFDPTNGLMPSDQHITLACGRDFGDVTPVRGVILGGGAHDLHVSVDVAPV